VPSSGSHALLACLLLGAACGSAGEPAASSPAAPAAPPAAAPALPGPAADAAPRAERRPVTDTYHGVAVVDPYRWLEADTPEVAAWSDAENRHARAVLDHLPGLAALRVEVRAIVAAPGTRYFDLTPVAGKWFALRKQPSREQPELVVMDDLGRADAARLVLDPTAAGGAHRTIDWFAPSPDGKRVAVSLSEGGSENGSLHILGLDGAELEKPIPDVQRGTGGGSAAWSPDGKSIYYTRYPAAGEKPEEERSFWMQLWFHRLGADPKTDRYELGKDFPRIAEIMLATDRRGRVLATVQKGDSGTFRHYLRARGGEWRQLDDWDDHVIYAGFGPTADLWLVSQAGAPRGKILRLPAGAKTAADAVVVVPEGPGAIVTDFYAQEGLIVSAGRVFAVFQTGGPSEIRAFTLDGKPAASPALPPVSAVGEARPTKDGIVFRARGYVEPPRALRFHARTGAMDEVPGLVPPEPVDLSAFEVHRHTARSKDGTQVPYSVIWKRGAAQDGSTPCVATGYGGFSSAQEPYFVSWSAPLLRRGVCWVETNLRGGNEFGDEWHQAGMLTRKQNVFDDFAAVLDDLVARKYTRPDRLGIVGGSNGGLLMGATLVQHPDKMRAVVSLAGIYDMLRVELSPNGLYNVPELGTVKDQAQFTAMHAYSPFHHVKGGTKYPAVLMTSGANDPRVSPMQSRKMIAALQEAQRGSAPILLVTSATSGHGMGTAMSERIDDVAHIHAFLLWQLGVPGDRAAAP